MRAGDRLKPVLITHCALKKVCEKHENVKRGLLQFFDPEHISARIGCLLNNIAAKRSQKETLKFPDTI